MSFITGFLKSYLSPPSTNCSTGVISKSINQVKEDLLNGNNFSSSFQSVDVSEAELPLPTLDIKSFLRDNHTTTTISSETKRINTSENSSSSFDYDSSARDICDDEREDVYEGAGQITNMVRGMPDGLVDNEYRFTQAKFASEGFFLHDRVWVKASRSKDSIDWRITEMRLHKDNLTLEIEDRQKYTVTQRKIKSVTALEIELEPMSTISTKAMDTIRNTLANICLVPGDWLEVKTEEVKSRGSSSAYGLGHVTVDLFERRHMCGKITQIGRAKFPSQDNAVPYAVVDNFCLVPDFTPSAFQLTIGKLVRLEIFRSQLNLLDIETNNAMKFWFRAISIVEDENSMRNNITEELRELYCDKGGICIEPKYFLDFKTIRPGNSKELSFLIVSSSYKTHVLLGVTVQGEQTVAKFTVDMKRESDDVVALFHPSEPGNFPIKVKCETKSIGSTKEYCVFDFGEFKIVKELRVKVIPEEKALVQNLNLHRVNLRQYRRITANERKEIERKHTTFLAPERGNEFAGMVQVRPPFFISDNVERLRAYPIPACVREAALNDSIEPIFQAFPTLRFEKAELPLPGITIRQLTPQNYQQILHVALWFEELSHIQRRQKYNMESVNFERSGNSYFIHFPGLQDVFPKFMINDPIKFCDPNDPKGTIYHANISRLGDSEIFFDLKSEIFKDYDGRPMSIEFLIGRISYKRCHHAIEKVVQNWGVDWLFPQSFICLDPRIDFVELDHQDPVQESHESALSLLYTRKAVKSQKSLRKIGHFENGKRATSVFPVSKHLHVLERDKNLVTPPQYNLIWVNEKLNEEQKQAVRMILRGQGRQLPYIIFGPPGTGKTMTVVESVIQIRRLSPTSRILLCGPSNASANQLAMYLMQFGKFQPGEFVRFLGYNRSESTIPELLVPYCMDGDCIEHIYVKPIIVTTCNTASQFLEKYGIVDGWFTHVFIDEAGYCYEPDATIPCLLVSRNREPPQVILAGDPKQLGPVVFDDTAAFHGLRTSLLERLMESPLYKRTPSKNYDKLLLTKLVKNYRAHPDLLCISSKLFYDNELIPASTENLNELADRLPFLPKRGVPLLFHGIRGEQSRDSDSPSWYNSYEVIQIVHYVQLLLENGCVSDDIGIISPYRKQVDKIKEALQKEVRCRPIRVGSVEEFQGGEKKVILLSLVRSMDYEDENEQETLVRLSFAFHPKRFNVCLTRAQCLLITVGNPHVFVKEMVWKEFLKFTIEKGVYIGCDLPLVLTTFDSHSNKNLEYLKYTQRDMYSCREDETRFVEAGEDEE